MIVILNENTNEDFNAALERGECLLFKGTVHGYGVQLSEQGPWIADTPVTLAEAEKAQEMLSEEYPEARVVRLGVDADMVAETQEPQPGDYFHISYTCESNPGEWCRVTNMLHYTYDEAIDLMERYRAADKLCVQLERIRAERPISEQIKLGASVMQS